MSTLLHITNTEEGRKLADCLKGTRDSRGWEIMGSWNGMVVAFTVEDDLMKVTEAKIPVENIVLVLDLFQCAKHEIQVVAYSRTAYPSGDLRMPSYIRPIYDEGMFEIAGGNWNCYRAELNLKYIEQGNMPGVSLVKGQEL